MLTRGTEIFTRGVAALFMGGAGVGVGGEGGAAIAEVATNTNPAKIARIIERFAAITTSCR